MKKQVSLLLTHGWLSLVFGMSVWVFFGYFYRYHLIYQEQYQLFLFSSDYMTETVGRIGGAADYVSRFLTQFYHTPWVGALLIALLLTALQRLVAGIARHIGGKATLHAPLSFLPSIAYGALLCDEHYMLTGVVAVTGVVAAFRAGLSIRRAERRVAFELAMIPALYVLAGGAAAVFVLLCFLPEVKAGVPGRKGRLLAVAGGGFLLLLMPLAAQYVFTQYPLAKLWTGGDYYRFPTVFPFPLLLLWLSIPAVALCLLRSQGEKKAGEGWWRTALWAGGLALAVTGGVYRMSDWKKEEVMRYDHYARTRQWERIISRADHRTPTSPLSVSLLNLALCKTGRMPDWMFHYFQNGPEGLLPSFTRDFSAPMMAGEIYYHLGFINTAQRFAFEAMEAIPDFQRSARAVKRLAETNLLNGHYDVARKYLRLLQQTLYYRSWATETLACLSDETQIEANPEWASLRKYRTRTDFLFSEEEKDMMLGILLQQDFSNRPAYEYLMAYCLLTKDLEHFYRYYPLGESLRYRTIPTSYQEALIYIWGQLHNTTTNIPYPISDPVKRRVLEYRRIYVNHLHAEPLLRGPFSDTYWYYLHFRK
ncbi:MAG: DUF6057 family protein [Tannerellaceae bacterium]|jgi:hypothetical protein|nr:DUF6057 family protein [Tannerellaceae bacterium]